jgi:hypothetical protein
MIAINLQGGSRLFKLILTTISMKLSFNFLDGAIRSHHEAKNIKNKGTCKRALLH